MGRRDHRRERQGPLRSIVGALIDKAGDQNQSGPQAQDPRDYRIDRGFGGPQMQYESPRDSKSDRGVGNQPNQYASHYEEPRDNDRGFGGQQGQYQPQYDDRGDYRNERRSRRRQKSPGPIHSIIGALTSKGRDQYQSRSLYDNQNDHRSDRGYRRRRKSSSSSGSSGSPGPIHSIIGAFANRNGGSQSRAPYDDSNSYVHSRRYQNDHPQFQPQFQPQYSNTNNYPSYSGGFEAQQAQRGSQYGTANQNTYNTGFGPQQTDFRPQSDGHSPFANSRDFEASPRAGGVQKPDFTDPDAMPPPYEASVSQPFSESRLPYGIHEME
jgi:hypothetical protein